MWDGATENHRLRTSGVGIPEPLSEKQPQRQTRRGPGLATDSPEKSKLREARLGGRGSQGAGPEDDAMESTP